MNELITNMFSEYFTLITSLIEMQTFHFYLHSVCVMFLSPPLFEAHNFIFPSHYCTHKLNITYISSIFQTADKKICFSPAF